MAPGGIDCARMRSQAISDKGRRPWNTVSRVGADRSKLLFQLHGVNAAKKVVSRKKLRGKEMEAVDVAGVRTSVED
jgi:hypothetical protein